MTFKFNKLIFTSTFKDDADIQEFVRKLSENESFEIEYWGWGRISKKLIKYRSLLNKYYPGMFGSTLKQLTSNPPKGKIFIGRDRELKDFHRINMKSKVAVVLNGMGGIGKTELAKEFYWNEYTNNTYSYYGWIDFDQSLKSSILNQLDVGIDFEANESNEVRLEKIIAELNLLQGKTLLVIDNYSSSTQNNNDDILLNSLSSDIKVILTSREVSQNFEEFMLGFLSEESCRELFYQYYNGEHNNEKLDEIIKLSGYHTLTIALLAKTAEEGDYSIEDLLSLIIELGFNLNTIVSDVVEHEKKYDLLFNHIRNLFVIVNLGQIEKHILTNLSILSSEYIERNIIRRWLELDNNNSINKLIKKGWIDSTKIENKTYIKCHKLIQEVVRIEDNPSGEDCDLLMRNLAGELKCNSWENRLEKTKFLNHALSVIKYIDEKTSRIACLLTNVALLYDEIGDFKTALDLLIKAKTICQEAVDINIEELAVVYHNLSAVSISAGNIDKAKEYGLLSKEIFEKIYDENNPELATLYNRLSIVYKEIGDLKEALKFGLQAKEIRETHDGENSPTLATVYGNLALIYQEVGNLDKALEYGLKAKDIKESYLSKNKISLGATYNNLALLYREKDDLKKAIEYGEMAKEISEKNYHMIHPILVTHYSNLSIFYHQIGDSETSLIYGLHSKDMAEKIYEKNNIILSRIYSNLSAVYTAKKEIETALDYSLKDKEICEKVYDKRHNQLATTYNNLSMLYYELKNYKEAINYGMKAKEIREEILGENHNLLATTYSNLSLIFQDYGNLNKALEYGLKSKRIFEKILEPTHMTLSTVYFNLAALYFKKKDIDTSIMYFEKSRKVYETSLYIKHPNLENVYQILIYLYRIKGDKKNTELLIKSLKDFNFI